MSNWTMVMPLFESRGERTSGRDRIDHSSLRERLHCSLSHSRVLERFRITVWWMGEAVTVQWVPRRLRRSWCAQRRTAHMLPMHAIALHHDGSDTRLLLQGYSVCIACNMPCRTSRWIGSCRTRRPICIWRLLCVEPKQRCFVAGNAIENQKRRSMVQSLARAHPVPSVWPH